MRRSDYAHQQNTWNHPPQSTQSQQHRLAHQMFALKRSLKRGLPWSAKMGIASNVVLAIHVAATQLMTAVKKNSQPRHMAKAIVGQLIRPGAKSKQVVRGGPARAALWSGRTSLSGLIMPGNRELG